ncbi:MAG: hypothetical protein ACM3QS_02110 [Bacteroidota bacterium]
MNTEKVNALFTKESLLSLQGAALVTLIVPNVLTFLIGASFQPYEKWVGFVIAMLMAFYIALQSSETGAQKWLIAVLNGFLIFAAAGGLTDVLGAVLGGESVPVTPGGRLPFFHSWFR